MDAAPLAERMRPRDLEAVVGHEHLVGPEGILRRALSGGMLPSMILWGPPGVGKTSYHDQVVWIIGASSGIGLALVHQLASDGATLVLSARRQESFEHLQSTLGARHKVFALDVTEPEMARCTAQAVFETLSRVDKIVFLARGYSPMDIESLGGLCSGDAGCEYQRGL